jgi:hypothetical protein
MSRNVPACARRGTENGRAKLRDVDVHLIRALRQSGIRQTMLCAIFAVSPYTVSQIVRGQKWTHL